MASLALMAAVALVLGRTSIVDVPTAVTAALAAVVLIRYRVGSLWLVLGGAVVGLVARVV